MVSTCIHLYCHSLYDVCGLESVTHIAVRSVCHSHPVCVPINTWIISYAHVSHMYWDIYGYISLFVHIPDNTIPVVIFFDLIA